MAKIMTVVASHMYSGLDQYRISTVLGQHCKCPFVPTNMADKMLRLSLITSMQQLYGSLRHVSGAESKYKQNGGKINRFVAESFYLTRS